MSGTNVSSQCRWSDVPLWDLRAANIFSMVKLSKEKCVENQRLTIKKAPEAQV